MLLTLFLQKADYILQQLYLQPPVYKHFHFSFLERAQEPNKERQSLKQFHLEGFDLKIDLFFHS